MVINKQDNTRIVKGFRAKKIIDTALANPTKTMTKIAELADTNVQYVSKTLYNKEMKKESLGTLNNVYGTIEDKKIQRSGRGSGSHVTFNISVSHPNGNIIDITNDDTYISN